MEGGTRRVQLVREGGGGEAPPWEPGTCCRCCGMVRVQRPSRCCSPSTPGLAGSEGFSLPLSLSLSLSLSHTHTHTPLRDVCFGHGGFRMGVGESGGGAPHAVHGRNPAVEVHVAIRRDRGGVGAAAGHRGELACWFSRRESGSKSSLLLGRRGKGDQGETPRVSRAHPVGDETCPVSTEGGTRRVQLVREGGARGLHRG